MTSTCIIISTIRWMENVSLDVIATCLNPAEIRGQRVRDVSVFKACPDKRSSADETLVVTRPPKLKKQKPSRATSPMLKVRPVKKAKSHKLGKTRPLSKAVAHKVGKNKKVMSN